MVPRLTDMGHDLSLASLVMSLCAGLGVAGKLSFGWLGDKLPMRRIMLLIVVIQFCGQYMMYSNADLLWFTVGAALFGYGVGGVVPMHGAIIGKTFGRERFGAVLGAMRPAMFPIQILGVPFAGWIYDTTGSYAQAFQVLFVLYVLAAIRSATGSETWCSMCTVMIPAVRAAVRALCRKQPSPPPARRVRSTAKNTPGSQRTI